MPPEKPDATPEVTPDAKPDRASELPAAAPRDALGWRKKFGVIAPSTNTIVGPDYYRMTVPGVTPHVSRIHIRNQNLSSDDAFEALLAQIREEIVHAVDRVMTCEPDYLVMGMSAETFWGGVAGNRAFKQRIKDQSGLDVATGAEACERALALHGARRIGLITPYQPIADENVIRFFSELGVEVVAKKGLRCPSAVAIAQVPEETLRQAILEVSGVGLSGAGVTDARPEGAATRPEGTDMRPEGTDTRPEVDAVVQVGTNLSMVTLADEAERWLGKPVIAINAATWWLALRENGINDKVHGCGSLLRDH